VDTPPQPAGAAIARVEALTFEYPGVRALDAVSFTVGRGSVTALVGPNGAGKTTLLRCVAGLDAPLLGRIEVSGVDVLESPREAHRHLGYLSDFFGVYDALTVWQCLAHAAAAQAVPAAGLPALVERTAGRLGLADRLGQAAGTLSRGLRQRLAIGQAIIHGPQLLLLDEPAAGLDPEARHGLAALFRTLQGEGMTLLVSSHILAELDEYSTHLLVLREGRIVEHRALDRGAAALAGVRRLRVALAAPDAALRGVLEAQPGVTVIEAGAGEAVVELTGGAPAQAELLSALVRAGLAVSAYGETRENLHESYLRTVGSRAEGGP
jgi:ABC-2 type transport system ATP-binding protein